jgi:hypothetical protein
VITYEYVEPKKTPEEAVRFLQETLFPLCMEFWERGGKAYFKADRWDIPMFDFIEMWTRKTLVIIAAKDGQGKPQGFLVGGLVRPFFHAATVLKVEAWYGRLPEIREGLFAHLASILKYFAVDRVTVPDFGDGVPDIAGFPAGIPQPSRTVSA